MRYFENPSPSVAPSDRFQSHSKPLAVKSLLQLSLSRDLLSIKLDVSQAIELLATKDSRTVHWKRTIRFLSGKHRDLLSINLDDYDKEVIEITGTILLVSNSDPTSIFLKSGVQLKQGIQILLNPQMLNDLTIGDTVTVKVIVLKDSSTFGYFFTGFDLEKE